MCEPMWLSCFYILSREDKEVVEPDEDVMERGNEEEESLYEEQEEEEDVSRLEVDMQPGSIQNASIALILAPMSSTRP